jgi:cardiolipin synthase
MLHAKTMVVDGRFASVGSLNLDNVSLRINDETTLLAWDPALGATMDSLFLADLEQADEIDLIQFERRPWHEKLRETFARLIRDFL